METVTGSVLVTVGLRRRSLVGTAMAIGGGWLVARGVSGRSRPAGALASMASERFGGADAGVPTDAVTVEQSITVGAPADELAQYWRDPELLTRIMGPFAEVTGAGEDRHRWTLELPRGPNPTWETEIVDDEPGERLRWESVEGATVSAAGDVRFRPAPGDRGTMVTLQLAFDPPGGELGDAVFQRLATLPETAAEQSLRRFKSLVETGEIPSIERNPSARGSGDLL
ncbi:SRPBCC family protein [Natrinema salaciae]|uniref:SRPBCC family protein n=1 Tax=Natrinema salaciae TaxID=1186196 RepID=UPI001FDF5AC5|nr:SRPBCC family protein [Natrinema salaciae]